SVPAQLLGSARSALGTPRKVASGPYIPPSRAIAPPGDHQSRQYATQHAGRPAPLVMAPGVPPAAGRGRETAYPVGPAGPAARARTRSPAAGSCSLKEVAGRMRASGAGSHQLALPSSSITAGTSNIRTRVASMSTA